MPLYDLKAPYAEPAAMLEDCETEEEFNEILDQMDALPGSISEKAENYARIMKNAEAEANGYAAEIKRLQARKRASENTVARMKVRARNAMVAAGATEIVTGIGKWRIQKNDYSTIITDIEQVPERFLIPQLPHVDKRAMLAEFKASGEIFDGVEFVRTESVQFR